MALECGREMSLVGKASLQRDVCNRIISLSKQAACELHPELSNVAADGAAVVPVEGAGEMRGVNPREVGEFGENWWVVETGLQNFANHLKPLRVLRAAKIVP